MIKNIPGPFEPPLVKRPKRNITARSYSCTTFMHKNNENGNVQTINIIDMIVNANAQKPELSLTLAKYRGKKVRGKRQK